MPSFPAGVPVALPRIENVVELLAEGGWELVVLGEEAERWTDFKDYYQILMTAQWWRITSFGVFLLSFSNILT